MLEILSFKMVIDFFTRLAVYGIEMDSVQVYFRNQQGQSYSFYNFTSLDQIKAFYENRYYPFDECGESLGIWQLNMFTVHSALDNYTMSFNVWDIGTGNWKISVFSQYDTDRNGVWEDGKVRQEGLIDNTIAEYWNYYTELYHIYIHGVYSPCYAVPPWTEYTTILQSYAGYFLIPNQPEVQDEKNTVVFIDM